MTPPDAGRPPRGGRRAAGAAGSRSRGRKGPGRPGTRARAHMPPAAPGRPCPAAESHGPRSFFAFTLNTHLLLLLSPLPPSMSALPGRARPVHRASAERVGRKRRHPRPKGVGLRSLGGWARRRRGGGGGVCGGVCGSGFSCCSWPERADGEVLAWPRACILRHRRRVCGRGRICICFRGQPSPPLGPCLLVQPSALPLPFTSTPTRPPAAARIVLGLLRNRRGRHRSCCSRRRRRCQHLLRPRPRLGRLGPLCAARVGQRRSQCPRGPWRGLKDRGGGAPLRRGARRREERMTRGDAHASCASLFSSHHSFPRPLAHLSHLPSASAWPALPCSPHPSPRSPSRWPPSWPWLAVSARSPSWEVPPLRGA